MEETQLEPARPDAGDTSSAYMPRVPWKWVLGIAAFLSVSVGTCYMRDRQEVEALRYKIRDGYASQLSPLSERYVAISGAVRNHVTAALSKGAQRYVDARLKLDLLGSAPGLYLRVRAPHAKDADSALADAAQLPPDAIARCLGVAPSSASELVTRGSFLDPAFIAQADAADTVMKLRVIAEELRQRSERDLADVGQALKAQWLLLVVERTESRHDGPVDVFLWDLRENALLLSERTEARGALVSARIAVGGSAPQGYAEGAQTGAAQDCAIANAVRALTGGAAPAFAAEPPTPRAAVMAALKGADAGAPDAGAGMPAADAAATQAKP
jgi:hypothetical protein